MEFETEDHAYKFYNMYACFIGFSVRKDWGNTSKLDKEWQDGWVVVIYNS
ncbi:unnamed protein product [Lupinus luteus]|uniref:Protein FAR1-RELATED SEQUENCE n=1 Tax=Lupinus luteus TaxID=3873 RepID=A0AAV1YHJ2_LUPLU